MGEHPTVALPPQLKGGQRPGRQWFYIGAGVCAILLSFAGFGPSLLDPSRRNAPPTTLVIAHSATAAAWLVLFLAQATLAATGRLAAHRRLGWVGPAIAAAIIVLGIFTSIEVTRRGFDLSGDVTRLLARPGAPPPTEAENIAGIWGPLGVLLTFSMLVAAGLWYRHRPEVHKRIMVFALVPLLFEAILHLCGALVGRVPVPADVLLGMGLSISLLLYAVVGIHDRLSQGRVHPASVWIPIVVVAWSVLSNAVIFPSAVGLKVAAWLVGCAPPGC